MQLSEFLSHLTLHPTLELVFEFPLGPIHKGYHLTEVLRSRVDAIDCGGAVDHWSETVLQLVEPGTQEGTQDGTRTMRTEKALAILQRSNALIALDADSAVLLEYKGAGDSSTTAAQRFHIESIQSAAGQLQVITRGTTTQCKAAERSQTVCGSKTQAASCCGSSASTGSSVPAAASACCA